MISNEAPRPLNLGEILDRTVQLYRDRFLVYLGIAIIPTGVLLVFGGGTLLVFAWLGALPGATTEPIKSGTALALGFLVLALISLPLLAVMLGVSSLSTAAMNHAAAGALAGKRPTIRGSFAEAWRRGWQYVWLYFLQALIVWGAPLIGWFVALSLLTALVAISHGAANPATGAMVGLLMLFGFMAVAGYALWMLLCTSLAFPGCVVEKMSAWKAIRRSFRLSKGTRGRVFVLYLLGAVLGWISSLVVTVIFMIVVALIPGMNSPQKAQTAGMAMIFLIYGSSFAVQACIKPVYAIALMLFYYDQRIRNEGFDIEWMMERAGLVSGVATLPTGDSMVTPDGVSVAAPNAESRPASSGDSIAVPAEMETVRDGAVSGAVHAYAEAELTEPAQPLEATEISEATEATEPEIGRQ
jgi:hypothetical protein